MQNGKRILLVQGHPDHSVAHLCHALADAYASGAEAVGHEVRRVDVAKVDFTLLRSQAEWEKAPVTQAIKDAQLALARAQHIVLFFPLWLGDMPALLKGFLEQVARPGFAFHHEGDLPYANKALAGRSARVVVTMGMPAIVYRWYFRAHSVKSLERNILGFIGIGPIHETLVGQVGNLAPSAAQKWLRKMEALGRECA